MPENKDPNHKWHERLPNDLGGLSTEIVVSVDIPLTTHGPNLEDLVQWVHWQLTVDSWHIRRHPEYEDHQVALLQHHPEWSLSGAEIPTGVVNDKSHHVRLWFEHSVDWWTIHPWQKLHPKWVWEPPSHYLVFTCSLRNSCSFLVFSRCHNLCHSFGYPLFIVSANGQKPLQSLMRTESTKGQFWWWVSSLSNMHLGLLLLYWRHVRPQEI